MNSAVQYIVTPSGERLVVLPEDEYLMLLAASEDDEGELKPELLEEVRRRIEAVRAGGDVVPMEALRKKR
jgi:PHD/YefM family antitoxin component YafN of YafNO toxin-antitoxin module